MDIKNNIKEFENIVNGHDCKLVAVSKTQPPSLILEAYNQGFRDFGENKIQELVEKYDQLPKDIHWHMIGHLQRNKVKFIAPFVYLIHAVDSLKLLLEIDKQAAKAGRIINCLLQIHIADELTKFGLNEKELFDLLGSHDVKSMQHIKILGLMGMATFTEDENQIRKEFKYLKSLFDKIKPQINLPNLEMKELSMGMSGDFKIAMEEGSTMIRVGSAIFGERNY